MIDEAAAQLALRARAEALVVATTGAISMSVTATGYARAAGSFLTDGFVKGMEVVGVAFGVTGNNGPHMVKDVSALALTCEGCAVESSAGGRSLSIGLPTIRQWDNNKAERVTGRPYLEEEFVHAVQSSTSFPANGAHVEERGLYILKWHGLNDSGITALRKSVGALKALFAPGTALIVGSSAVRVQESEAPYSGKIIPEVGGWSVLVLTVPWRAYTTNVVAP